MKTKLLKRLRREAEREYPAESNDCEAYYRYVKLWHRKYILRRVAELKRKRK